MFQLKEVMYCKRWLRDNFKTIPKHLWEHLVLKQSKRQKFRELFSHAEDDMKSVIIIDSDFELIQFLADAISGRSCVKNSMGLNVLVTNENFTNVKGTLYSIENVAKALLSFDYSKTDDVLMHDG